MLSYQNGALLTVVPVELHHGFEREIADHITVQDEKRVCSLTEQGHHHLEGLSPWNQAQQSPSKLNLALSWP